METTVCQSLVPPSEDDALSPAFVTGILLKVGFKGELFRNAQAFLVYVALDGRVFTADCLPDALSPDNTTSGCAVAALRGIRLIEACGRCKSPSKKRNGAWVSQWRLASGRRSAALSWLRKNHFPVEEQQAEFSALTEVAK